MDLEIYGSKAHYYAAAFDWPVDHQVEKISGLSGIARGRVLEPMCGSARLLRSFASAGFETVGVDLSGSLLDIARGKFAELGLAGAWVEAEVTDFTVHRLCDLAVCPINSLAHLQSVDEMVRHLQAVSRSLASGGNYWIQLDLKHAMKVDPVERWEFELDNQALEFEWSVVEFNADFEMHQDCVFKDGEVIFQERHQMKRWTYEDWMTLLGSSPFEFNAAYDGDTFEPLRLGPSLEDSRVFWQQLVQVR